MPTYKPSKYAPRAIDQSKINKYKEFVQEITGSPDNSNPERFLEKLAGFYPAHEVTSSHSAEKPSELLQTNFILGECHDDRAPKNFLIENMALIKAAGYTTLFLEHLYYDDQQELDDYDPSSLDTEANKKMRDRLFYLDRGFGISSMVVTNRNCQCEQNNYLAGNNFSELVSVAKKFGIRVVGIDTEYTYSEQYDPKNRQYAMGGPTNVNLNSFRLRSMNYTAFKIIEKEMKEASGKWFALTGIFHCYSAEDFSGLPQLTGAKTVIVFSQIGIKQEKVEYNKVRQLRISTDFFSDKTKKIEIPFSMSIVAPKDRSISPISTIDEKLVQDFEKTSQEQITPPDTSPKFF